MLCSYMYVWFDRTIGAGALGYPGVVHGMFPQGGADLVSYFYVSCNQKLAETLKESVETSNRDKIR